MRVAIGFDHAGIVLRPLILEVLASLQCDVVDKGVRDHDRCDYPERAFAVGEAVAWGEAEKGILCCGTGLGMAIAANRIHGIRAVTVGDVYSARMSREHNDANVLCLGGRVLGLGLAEEILRVWLTTGFPGGESHARRLATIAEREDR